MKTRRQFLKESSVLTAGLFIIPENFFVKQPPIGVQLYTLRNEVAKDPVDTITRVARLGYRQIETYGYKDRKWFGLSVDEFKKLLKENDLSSPSGHTYGGQYFLEPNWEEGWKTVVADAKAIGQEYIVVPWLDQKYRSVEHYKKLTDQLNKAGTIAQQSKLKLAYHNHDFEFADQSGQNGLDILMRGTDTSLVHFELDIYWATKAGHDPIALFNKYPGRFAMWHVKDMDNTPEKKFTEVGNGVIDFTTIFKNAKKSGMQYFFVEQDQCPGSPFDSIQTSITNLKERILK